MFHRISVWHQYLSILCGILAPMSAVASTRTYFSPSSPSESAIFLLLLVGVPLGLMASVIALINLVGRTKWAAGLAAIFTIPFALGSLVMLTEWPLGAFIGIGACLVQGLFIYLGLPRKTKADNSVSQ